MESWVVFSVVVNIVLSLILIQSMREMGIALATSISAWINAFLLYFMLKILAITWKPNLSKCKAHALPIPVDAPVITIVLECIDCDIVALCLHEFQFCENQFIIIDNISR